MSFLQAIQSGFSNLTNFSGRAPRSEYWYWILFTFILLILVSFPLNQAFMGMSNEASPEKFLKVSSIISLV